MKHGNNIAVLPNIDCIQVGWPAKSWKKVRHEWVSPSSAGGQENNIQTHNKRNCKTLIH